MSSTLHITPIWGQRPAQPVVFGLPIKSVFGRRLCDTDGSIGFATQFSAETALEIVDECRTILTLTASDSRKLAQVRKWALAGNELFAEWIH